MSSTDSEAHQATLVVHFTVYEVALRGKLKKSLSEYLVEDQNHL